MCGRSWRAYLSTLGLGAIPITELDATAYCQGFHPPPSRIRMLFCNRLNFKGLHVFNTRPNNLRNWQGVDVKVFRVFRQISEILDEQPMLRQEKQRSVALSNSLLHQKQSRKESQDVSNIKINHTKGSMASALG